MNRPEMAKQIEKLLPTLAKMNKDRLKIGEALRSKFVSDYSISRIRTLTIDNYVIGNGSKDTFCYRIERETDSLGRILGSRSDKFGVYLSKEAKGRLKEYRPTAKWGHQPVEAFSAVKKAITDLIIAAGANDLTAVRENRLPQTLKGKILFMYYPEEYAPVYSDEHLEHFIAELNLVPITDHGPDMQRELMRYRSTWPQLQVQSPLLYMDLLYFLFGYPSEKSSTEHASDNLPLLDQAVKRARFIDNMPASSPVKIIAPNRDGKTDYEARQRQLSRIGGRGEAIVLALERERLVKERRLDLADRIIHVSEQDDSAGYDILSFDSDGTERPIEVKATAAKNLDQGFYISDNELKKASSLQNYHLYFVFLALGDSPEILRIKRPDFKNAYIVHPMIYRVFSIAK